MPKHYLACDLGAESGRLIHGQIADQQLSLTELHRFPNRPIRSDNSIHWDIPSLIGEVEAGLRIAAQTGLPFQSISCDSWGVDYLLLDESEQIISPTFHYRDPRTARGMENTLSRTDWPTIFDETGIQMMPLNALIQLAAETPERLKQSRTIVGVGDGFNFLLGGRPVVEISMASTFQLYNPRTRSWSEKLLEAMEFPAGMFPEVVASGTRIGQLTPRLQEATGLGPIDVIATCSHDTGAAVAAVPAEGDDWAYLSSGTWSLMGVERTDPVLTDACRDLNFTNEIGYGNSIRLLKNISGLWLLQESKRAWSEAGTDLDYGEITRLGEQAEPFRSLIDPMDPHFVAPDHMPAAIQAFCRETQQPEPQDPGAVTRCILESLALLYRQTMDELETLTGQPLRKLHIVGGGSKNQLLNQLTANAIQRPVVTGPVEATAAGNIVIQALSSGDLTDLKAARALVRASHTLQTIEPTDGDSWNQAAERFKALRR